MQNRKIWIWIVIAVFLVGGLGYVFWPRDGEQASAPEMESGEPANPTVTTAAEEILPTEALPTEEIKATEGSGSEATVEITDLPPTPRQELESTNPDTVNLASGGVQLVEVFAFW